MLLVGIGICAWVLFGVVVWLCVSENKQDAKRLRVGLNDEKAIRKGQRDLDRGDVALLADRMRSLEHLLDMEHRRISHANQDLTKLSAIVVDCSRKIEALETDIGNHYLCTICGKASHAGLDATPHPGALGVAVHNKCRKGTRYERRDVRSLT